MFVIDGARTNLLKDERQKFLEQEWPSIILTIKRLGLEVTELMGKIGKSNGADKKTEGDQE